MLAFKLDKQGFIQNRYLIGGDTPIPTGCITVQLPQPLPYVKPKWNGNQWIEGETLKERQEREAEALLDRLKPTKDEIFKAELSLEILITLIDLKVVR